MIDPSNTAKETSVFILAAGRGERMRPLTDHTPKPLLKIGEHSLIAHHLVRLKQFGFKNIIINIAHLGEQIIDAIGDGSEFDLNVSYSDERESGALETAGGIKKVLELTKANSILVINGDVWTDYDFSTLPASKLNNHIVLVPNPTHNPKGDFSLNEDRGCATRPAQSEEIEPTYTFSGIGIYSKELFDQVRLDEKTPLGPLLFECADKGELGASIYNGEWHDIGTPERLDLIRLRYDSL